MNHPESPSHHYHPLSSSIIQYHPLSTAPITMHHHASPIFTNHIQSSPCITRHETMWIWRLLFYPCGCGTLSFHSWIATHSQTTGSKPLHWLHPTVSHFTKQYKTMQTIPHGIWGVGLGEPKRRGTQPHPTTEWLKAPYKMVFQMYFEEKHFKYHCVANILQTIL